MILLATLIGLAAAPATTDWRFLTVNGEGSGALFVDATSIVVTPDNHRDAEVFLVLKADNSDGAAAIRAKLQVDCTNHRQRNVHIWMINASNGAMMDGDITDDWAPIKADTPAVVMEGYVCADPANRKVLTSFGETVPIAKVRGVLNNLPKQ